MDLQPCFPEPTAADERAGFRRERLHAFLARSTWRRAAETRAFYNESLAALPAHCGEALCRRLEAEGSEAPTFELIVGRFLQLRGALELACEEDGPGRHPDWHATFPDGALRVEATVPLYNAGAGIDLRRQARLIEALESYLVDGWWLNAIHLPDLDDSAPLGPFKREVERLMAEVPSAEGMQPGHRVELRGAVWGERLVLSLIRTETPGGLGLQGGIAYMDNSELRIKVAWADKRKRSQGRSVPPPALLAIQGGFPGADLEDFQNALFGRNVRRPDGAMAIDADPPWSGVLAFPRVSAAGAADPVLFVAPAYTGSFPAAIEHLEVRRLHHGRVAVQLARESDVMGAMRWAQP